MKVEEWQWLLESIRDTLGGVAGGTACVYSTQPLDTTKVKMQTFPSQYRSVLQTLTKTFKTEGIRGLYAGSVPAVLANVGESSSAFLAYGRVSKVFQKITDCKSHEELSLFSKTLCGCFSGVFASFILTPTELIKCRLQTQYIKGTQSNVPKTPFKLAWHIIRNEGALKIMKGWTPTVIREGWGYSFFFGGYEATLVLLNVQQGDELSLWKTAVAGGIGGSSCWAFSYPIDVIKSRVQVSEKAKLTIGMAISDVYKSNGIRGFFNGLTPCLMRAFPGCGVLFVTVEYFKKGFDFLFLNSNQLY